ncbi:membrane protein [Streptomyces vietnamensis]|uniref:Membrane protein n=1 Tax=Streptomyces vietnamensis TaxID=362257 RepID=A0A0B5I9L9_9ACTN|nr:membrane protein [Streptomyces vietnamensis]AJF66368.1 membrane protein [Streptomyces vietnamensis]
MPAERSLARRVSTTIVAALLFLPLLLATAAQAAPTPTPSTPSPSASASRNPSDSDCSFLVGEPRTLCERSQSGGGSVPLPETNNEQDPLASLARGFADAAIKVIDELSKAVKETADVDFTNMQFLGRYAIVFAAATFLTLLLWLLAVAKRAVRGVPLTTALSEAIGFLWLTVLASAFTPLILYTVVNATDAITEVIASGTGQQTDIFFGSFKQALQKGDSIGGGPIMLIIVSLVTVIAAGVLYLELFLRAVLLYVGALLGVVVYSGLVDKNMWGHVRRWAGIMIAIILVKPVIVIVLGLAGALSSDTGPDSVSAVVSGLSIILLAIFASAMIYRFVPGFGDEIAASRNNRLHRAGENAAAAVISSPASLVSQGIKTHSTRDNGGGTSQSSAPRPANPVSGGMAAHSSRGAGGGGGTGGATPPPRSSSPTAGTPHSNRKNTGAGGAGR